MVKPRDFIRPGPAVVFCCACRIGGILRASEPRFITCLGLVVFQAVLIELFIKPLVKLTDLRNAATATTPTATTATPATTATTATTAATTTNGASDSIYVYCY